VQLQLVLAFSQLSTRLLGQMWSVTCPCCGTGGDALTFACVIPKVTSCEAEHQRRCGEYSSQLEFLISSVHLGI